MIRQTLDRLHEMKLTGMAEGLSLQLEQPASQGLPFEERFGLLVARSTPIGGTGD